MCVPMGGSSFRRTHSGIHLTYKSRSLSVPESGPPLNMVDAVGFLHTAAFCIIGLPPAATPGTV